MTEGLASDEAVLDALADLLGGSVLPLEPGERLHKLYFLRSPAARDAQFEHRIYTKRQANGLIGLVSYGFQPGPNGDSQGSRLARAGDIPEDTLNQLIWNVVRQVGIGPEQLVVVDLSHFQTLDEQLHVLRGMG